MRHVYYPTSDGKPIAESDLHRDLMADLLFALKWFLQDTKAYVSGKLFIYYEEGNPKTAIDPDIFVIMGVDQHQRRNYKVWEEGGRLPDVVIELTSHQTRKIDQTKKPSLYAQLGIYEYFIFDPYEDYLKPRLQGFRLEHGVYVRLPDDMIYSKTLGLDLRAEGEELRLYNALTGERLATRDETVLLRQEAEIARLRALLEQRGE